MTQKKDSGLERADSGKDSSGAGSREDKVLSLVEEFYETKEQEADAERRRKKVRSGQGGRTALAAVLCAAVWIVPVYLRPEPVEVTAPEVESGTRVTVYLTSLDVSSYLESTGRLPETLEEAGVEDDFISYTRLNDSTFELSAPLESGHLTFHSSMTREEFLGDAAMLLVAK